MEIEKSRFSNEELMGWRSILEKRKKHVLLTEESLKRHALEELSGDVTGEISKTRLHSADLATDTQEVETMDALSIKNLKQVREIDDAMIRVDKGIFGLCLYCGDPIPTERLKIVPESSYCVDCQQELEKKQKYVASDRYTKVEALSKVALESLETISTISVGDIMQESPVTVHQNESLDAAAELLSQNKIRHIPVVDDKGDVQGIISDRDLLGAILNVRPWKALQRVENAWNKTPVSHVMTITPETIGPEATLFDAGSVLLENKISCLPVVDGNHLIGIVTEADFVKLLSQGFIENA